MKSYLILPLFAIALSSCNRQDRTSTAPAAPAEQVAATPYPLDVCIVSGEPLGSMGEPVVIVHEGREIKFCCDACLPSFNEDPDKYVAKLEAAPAE